MEHQPADANPEMRVNKAARTRSLLRREEERRCRAEEAVLDAAHDVQRGVPQSRREGGRVLSGSPNGPELGGGGLPNQNCFGDPKTGSPLPTPRNVPTPLRVPEL